MNGNAWERETQPTDNPQGTTTYACNPVPCGLTRRVYPSECPECTRYRSNAAELEARIDSMRQALDEARSYGALWRKAYEMNRLNIADADRDIRRVLDRMLARPLDREDAG